MRIGAIDIGTNTFLLLVADVDEKGTVNPAAYEQRIPRLGKDVDAQKIIGKPAFERAAVILQEYKTISDRLHGERLVVAATSAVRDAANKKEFLSFIKAKTGLEIEILSGEEEASLTYLGAASGLRLHHRAIAVVDIGGGSTEITLGTRKGIQKSFSLDIGSVRVTERYLQHDPPLSVELAVASEFVENALHHLNGYNFRKTTIVGVAGTATTLAALDQGLSNFDRTKISGYKLSRQAIETLYRRLRVLRLEKILALSNVTLGRADILTAGTLILHELMKKTNAEEIIVSERGVRYGLVLREWEKQGKSKKAKVKK